MGQSGKLLFLFNNVTMIVSFVTNKVILILRPFRKGYQLLLLITIKYRNLIIVACAVTSSVILLLLYYLLILLSLLDHHQHVLSEKML